MWVALAALPLSDGCAGPAPVDPTDPGETIELPTPNEGFQVAVSPVTLEPGEERYFCQFARVPVDGDIDVGRIESLFGTGAHHLILIVLDEIYVDDTFLCDGLALSGVGAHTGLGPLAGRFLYGAQTAGQLNPRTALELPEGAGIRLRAGQTLLFNYHWQNARSTPIVARAVTNFHAVPGGRADRLADTFFFFNREIRVEPSRESISTMRCTFPTEVSIVSMVSHMHQLGVEFVARRFDGAVEGDLVYRETSWQDPRVLTFPPSMPEVLASNTGYSFTCRYKNPDPMRTVEVGERASDEMCILIGYYLPSAGSLFAPDRCEADPPKTVSP